MNRKNLRALVPLAAAAIAAAGCGSSGSSSSHSPSAASQTSTSSNQVPPSSVADLRAAEHPDTSQFPAAHGRTLQQLAGLVKSSAQLGAATGTFTPGTRRFAFALNASSGSFIYAPTVVYLAKTPSSVAVGPFPAPADPMSVATQYRSKQNAGPGGIQAIYGANVPLPRAGTYVLLAITKGPGGMIGSPGEVAVAGSSPIPQVGQRPPAIATDTLSSVHGDVGLLTTRLPPESMHSVSFDQALGKQPVALLFSTPQLCTSKVCGPVTDIAVSLQHQFPGITFIHQEVYAANQPTKGLRPQMKDFHLETEPWLFTINRQGIIAARVEGAFGVNTMRQALQAALR
jgi:hypothetical protein